MDQALEDLRVLDLTHYVAGPVCTKALADFGADVIKVERPGMGDRARHLPPFLNDSPHPEKSGLFLYLNNNKRGVTLNLKTRAGIGIFKELVLWADVVVENFRPSVLPGLGLGYEALGAINPGLVMTSISNFGQTGPYRDFEATESVYYALSGLMFSTGRPDREPIKLGANVIQYQAGIQGALHTMIALHGREIRGHGQHVDISIHEVQTGSIDRIMPMLLAYQYTGEVVHRGFQVDRGGASVHLCQDGYLNMYPEEAILLKCLEMIGRSDLKSDPLFSSPEARSSPESSLAIDELLTPWLLEHTVIEAWAFAQEARIMSGPVYTSAQLVADPNFSARGFWSQVERPHIGRSAIPGRPFNLYSSPWSLRRPAPTLGEHNREVYSGLLGYGRGDLAKLRELAVI
ncbi:MAG: CoA transferase [Dehalococcoidia bacterium]